MLIAHISDSHIAIPTAGDHDRAQDLRSCVDYINSLDPLPDLVVHGGDIAHNGRAAEYDLAAEILNELKPGLRVIPGNRDDRRTLLAVFANRLPDDCHGEFIQYAIHEHGVCAIMLDTVSTDSNKGRLCDTRLAHLGAMLNETGDSPVHIFMHHTPFDVFEAPDSFQFEDRRQVDLLAEIIVRHANIRHVHCGHMHRPARGKIGGVSASTLPCIAADLRKGPPADMVDVCVLYRSCAP